MADQWLADEGGRLRGDGGPRLRDPSAAFLRRAASLMVLFSDNGVRRGRLQVLIPREENVRAGRATFKADFF